MEEKKKSGKLKKIIIAVLAVVVIAAIVIGVLLATGKLDLNFSKKSKMVAGVEKLGEAVTEPIDKIADTAEKNGTTPKILDNIKADSAIEVSTELTANIDEISSPELSSSQKSTIKDVIKAVNDSKLGMNFRYDGDKSAYAKVSAEVGKASISGEAVYDGKQAGVRSEEINPTWLTISNDDIEDLIKESGVDLSNSKDTIEKSMKQIEKLADSVNIDEKKQKEIRKRYEDVLKDFINEKSKDDEKEKDKVTVDGKEKSCSKLTLELDDDDLKDLLKAYIKTFSKDKDLKNILTDVMDTYAEIMEESGDKKSATQLKGAVDLVYDNIDTVLEEVDEISFDGKVILTVYATTTNVYRTDIIVEAEGSSVKLETTFNKEKTVTNISVNASGMSVKVGTLTLTSKEDCIGLRFDASKTLLNLAGISGDDYYFEYKYKVSKSKTEFTIDGSAGEYGHTKISVVTNIEKNTDTEYVESTEFAIDADAPKYATIKMTMNMKTNIKLGSVSIPSIKDSVDMTDEKELEDYAKDSEEKIKEVVENFSKVDSLKPFMEEILDELE